MKRTRRRAVAAGAAVLGALASGGLSAAGDELRLESAVDVEPVWSGHGVGFALLTRGGRQYAGYYDRDRRMTIAARAVDTAGWTFHKLPRTTGWDSHNYVAMAVDRAGHLHVAGDMHCTPLYYLRTAVAGEAASLAQVPVMVNADLERQVTYPVFLDGPAGELIFRYRNGRSGNGDDLFNGYDVEAREWRPLVDRPVVSGRGRMNAYCTVPRLGPDGFFHMVWVWRDGGGCELNHDLSYARSRDLRAWEAGSGRPLALPITLDSGAIVDPVPVRGGMINGNTKLGFDHRRRPVVAYHKYDASGNTQIFNARWEEGEWRIYQTSRWTDYRWEFGGGGSIPFEVSVSPVEPAGEGRLTQRYHTERHRGTWVLEESTLQPLPAAEAAAVAIPAEPGLPLAVRGVESDFPGLRRHICFDSGPDGGDGVRYAMAWDTLGSNRDRPREEPLPPPSMLRVFKLRQP